MKRTLLLFNPKSGRQNYVRFFLPRILQVFDKAGISYEIVQTRYPGHAGEIVSRKLDQIDSVTVFGGDGSIRDAVKGFDRSSKPLGIIPVGTVNVLALDLCLPFDPIQAAQVIAEGRTRSIDVGYANGDPFLIMASTGIDAMAVHTVNPAEKSAFGRVAYILSAFRSLFAYKPRPVEIYIPDTGVSDWGYLALISNSRFYGGPFRICRDSAIDDGLLDIFLFKRGSIRDTFGLFLGVLTGTHGSMKNIAFHKGKRVLIFSKKKVFVQVDGDKSPSPPLEITLRSKYLPVFVPSTPAIQALDPKQFSRILLKQAKAGKKPAERLTGNHSTPGTPFA